MASRSRSGLKGSNLLLFGENIAEVVYTIQQTELAKGVDLELMLLAIRQGHGLVGQVDGKLGFWLLLHQVEQQVDCLGWQYDGEQTVFEAVVIKNIAVARGDHGT